MIDILIELHARDPAKNRHRAWRVVAGADLFGLWTAHVNFGRIGMVGRTMRHCRVAVIGENCLGSHLILHS